jgi:hypothetical protein
MAKPTAITVPSDDCVVTIGGKPYNVHEGETVTLVETAPTIRDQQALLAFHMLGPKVAAAEGDPEELQAILPLLDRALEDVCAMLAERVVDWTWTNDRGRPLPKPDGTGEPFKALRDDEVMYLIEVVKGESPAARKNG